MTPAFNAAEWLVDRQVVDRGGNRIAHWCLGNPLPYGNLLRQTWRAAQMLLELGVKPGDRVIMVVLDELAFPAVFLGALRIAAVPIPVSTMLKAQDVAKLAADSLAKVIILSEPFSSYIDPVKDSDRELRAVVVVDSGVGPTSPREGDTASDSQRKGVARFRWSDFDSALEVTAVTSGDTDGFWLYTSGTTGRPKGAMHRHGDIKAVADTYGETVLGIGPDDVCYSIAKLFFAFGLGNSLFFPLSVGASSVLDPLPPTPPRAAELASAHLPTLFFAPPGFCAALVDSGVPAATFSSVRATITAGETLPAAVYRRFTDRFDTEMLDGIGSTEALHIFCSNHSGDVRPGSTGRVVEGYELKVLDEYGQAIDEPDVPGDLWVRGDSVTRGYWQRPDENKSTFVDGWCRTGDVYRRDSDGYYYFVGRNSDMIKTGGIWVSPAEVEAVLLEHPSVLEAAVVGGRTSDGLETTVAFLVPAAGASINGPLLAAHCRERMAAFKRPREIFVVDTLPKTATGKIQRFALRDRLQPATSAGAL